MQEQQKQQQQHEEEGAQEALPDGVQIAGDREAGAQVPALPCACRLFASLFSHVSCTQEQPQEDQHPGVEMDGDEQNAADDDHQVMVGCVQQCNVVMQPNANGVLVQEQHAAAVAAEEDAQEAAAEDALLAADDDPDAAQIDLTQELLAEAYERMAGKKADVRCLVAEMDRLNRRAAEDRNWGQDHRQDMRRTQTAISSALQFFDERRHDATSLRLQLIALGVQPPAEPAELREHPSHRLGGRRI